MPELPDVERFKHHLNKALHKTIRQVVIAERRLLDGVSARKLAAHLKGNRFESSYRHGKYLLIKLKKGRVTDNAFWHDRWACLLQRPPGRSTL